MFLILIEPIILPNNIISASYQSRRSCSRLLLQPASDIEIRKNTLYKYIRKIIILNL